MNRIKKVAKVAAIVLLDLAISALIICGSYFYYYKIPHSLPSLNIPIDKYVNNKQDDWSKKFADYFSDKVISTDTSYRSKDISVNIECKTLGTGKNKITYYIADVYVANISCFHTRFANDTYGVGYSESLSGMSEKVNAILAINGDSYNNNRHQDNGTIIRNGTAYRIKSSPYDICVLYYDGVMRTYASSDFNAKDAISKGAYQTWIFGPELLDEDGKAKTSFFTWDYIRKSHPRSAIGYYEPGHYCFVLVDGRQTGYSRGMYLKELAKVFEGLGCKAAYNLDGGYSSFLTFCGSIVNKPYKSDRTISDCIFIGEPQ